MLSQCSCMIAIVYLQTTIIIIVIIHAELLFSCRKLKTETRKSIRAQLVVASEKLRKRAPQPALGAQGPYCKYGIASYSNCKPPLG